MPNQNYTLLYYQENKIGFFSKGDPIKESAFTKSTSVMVSPMV